eukprot:m.474392 g.474392  ORF g.474392 m.474392 type:complete len:98 (-) comp36173_c0_seq1:203-496(-)
MLNMAEIRPAATSTLVTMTAPGSDVKTKRLRDMSRTCVLKDTAWSFDATDMPFLRLNLQHIEVLCLIRSQRLLTEAKNCHCGLVLPVMPVVTTGNTR